MKHKLFTFFVFLAWMSAFLPARPVQAETLASPLMYANGDFVWAKGMGGASYDLGTDVTVDSSGNVYTTGNFYGTVDFDPGMGVLYLTSVGDSDIFVSKLDSSGNLLWAKSMGGTNYDKGYSIAVDPSGNVHTIGGFYGTVDFDPSELSGFYLNSAGGSDIFVSKLNSSGNFVWARRMGGTNFDSGTGIAVDSSGNVYTTGSFRDIADFDPGAGIVNLIGAGVDDIFVSKLNSGGNFVWAKGIGGSDYDYGNGIAVDLSGNVYTTGSYLGTVDFDSEAGVFNLTSAGGHDIFVSKLNSGGNFVWAKSMGGVDGDYGNGIAVDSSGNVYTTGYFGATADFDPGTGTANLTSMGVDDIFVSKLDGSGNFAWARGMGGTDYDSGYGIATDSNGNVYTTGHFSGTADFDPNSSTVNLISAGSYDIFVSKLDNGGNFVWAKNMGGIGSDYGYGIATDSSGNVYTTGSFSSTADFDPDTNIFNLASAGGDDVFISKLDTNEIPTFSDVPSGYWAWRYVERLYAAGITGGCVLSPLQYCPDSSVTRAQMAIFLLKGVHGSNYVPPAVNGNTGFGDVAADYWAAAWIKQLAAEGITGGCGGGNYCPESVVTRAQMAVFLLKAKNGSSYSPPAVGGSTGFNDVTVDYWAAPFIKQLVADGITSGCGNSNYCPDSNVTRAQMAIFLVKTFNLP